MEMVSMVEQIAKDKDLAIVDVNDIFERFSILLLSRIPELKQVIEDVVANEQPDKLKEHINKMIILLQQRPGSEFKTWSMPEQNFIFRQRGNGQLF